MLAVAIILSAAIGIVVLVVLVVVFFVAWLVRASERAYRTPPPRARCSPVWWASALS